MVRFHLGILLLNKHKQMKKLRLLFTPNCNRRCEGCCNKDWELDELPEAEHFDYDEILITGGEPLLYPEKLIGFLKALNVVSDAKLILYTAMTVHRRKLPLFDVMPYLDGVTITLHEQNDVDNLKSLLYNIEGLDPLFETNPFENKSLRLNVFKGIDISGLDLSDWEVKDNMEWIKDCPLPENEEFKQI